MDINALVAQAKAAAEQLEDQTEVNAGGDFEYETPPEGMTPARFVGYVELGKRGQRPYQGKDKPDADEVRLYFELNGTKHQRKVVVDGVEKTFTNTIQVKVAKKLSDKAAFYKLFKKMLYGRDSITHMAQMLGEGFLIRVVHNTVEKDGKKNVYANMRDDDGNWLIQSPMMENPLTNETTPVPVPDVSQSIKLLLWDAPSKEQWDSIFIDGTRTVKDAKGVETEVSRNWIQEDIVKNAKNFEGSALEAMIGGIGDLDMAPETPAESAGAAVADSGASDAKKPESGAVDPNADPLAAMGL